MFMVAKAGGKLSRLYGELLAPRRKAVITATLAERSLRLCIAGPTQFREWCLGGDAFIMLITSGAGDKLIAFLFR